MKVDEKFFNRFGKLRIHLKKLDKRPEYHGVLDDLVEFTGMTPHEVCKFVALRRGSKGHFVDEYKWRSPKSPTEISWFYRSCVSYLFGNAERTQWDKTDFLDESHEPILDYGGGIGNTSIGLAKRGLDTKYYDISILQREFVKFRAYKKKLWGKLLVLDDVDHGFLDGEQHFGTVILQDVLEHVPEYPLLLKRLIRSLKTGGLIVEYSPFWTDKLNSPVHLRDCGPLPKVMADLGMKRVDGEDGKFGTWKKL